MFGFLSGSKYWGLYQDLYPILTEKGGGRFPQMFAEEFVKAYERHIAESMRAHRGGQLPSIKLEPPRSDSTNRSSTKTSQASRRKLRRVRYSRALTTATNSSTSTSSRTT